MYITVIYEFVVLLTLLGLFGHNIYFNQHTDEKQIVVFTDS